MTYHVETIPWSVAGNNVDLFVGVQPDDILESNLLIRTNATRSGAADDLEINKVNVDGVSPEMKRLARCLAGRKEFTYQPPEPFFSAHLSTAPRLGLAMTRASGPSAQVTPLTFL